MPKKKERVFGGLFSFLFAVFYAFIKKLNKKDDPSRIDTRPDDDALRNAPDDVCAEWQEFYRRVFGLKIDFSKVRLPDRRIGFGHLLFIPQGLTVSQVVAASCKRFEVHAYVDNLDRDVYLVQPCPEDGSYVVWLPDRPKANERLDYGSLRVLHDTGVRGISLIERLVHELKYLDQTGRHLNVGNSTLCGGSWHLDGLLVDIYWLENTLFIGRQNPSPECERVPLSLVS